jgi:hypothetical protein
MRPRCSLVAACVLLLAAALAGAGSTARADCAAIDPLSLLPPEGACDWARDGVPQSAHTLEELAQIIDGGAFLFGQYGFVAAVFGNYAGEIGGEPAAVTVSIFNQGTAANAEALYTDPNSGSGDPLPGWVGSGAARYRAAFGFFTCEFWEECFYGSIVFTAGGDAAMPEALCLGQAIVDAISQATPAQTLRWGDVKAAFREPRR